MNQQGVPNALNDIVDLMLGFLHVSLFTLSVHCSSVFSKYTVVKQIFKKKGKKEKRNQMALLMKFMIT